jgi:hypothetical protein
VVKDFLCEGFPVLFRDASIHEVEQRVIHSDETDRREMVFPVFMERLLDVRKIEARIGMQPAVSEVLDEIPLNLQALACEHHQCIEPFEEIGVVFREVSDPGHVEGDDTNRTGLRVGTKQPPASSLEFSVIQA